MLQKYTLGALIILNLKISKSATVLPRSLGGHSMTEVTALREAAGYASPFLKGDGVSSNPPPSPTPLDLPAHSHHVTDSRGNGRTGGECALLHRRCIVLR